MKTLKKLISLEESIGKTITGFCLDGPWYNMLIVAFDDSFCVVEMEGDELQENNHLHPLSHSVKKESLVLLGIVDSGEYDLANKKRKDSHRSFQENHERQEYERLKKKFEGE